MPVPKQHASRKRTGDRRKHIVIKPLSLAVCSHCKASIIPHYACPECGYYRGKQVLVMEIDKKTKEDKDKSPKGKKVSKEQDAAPSSDKPLSIDTLSKKK